MGFRKGAQYVRMTTEDMIRIGIIIDPRIPPGAASISLVERRHRCDICGSAVMYVKDAKGSVLDYHFECTTCKWSAKQAPLKLR